MKCSMCNEELPWYAPLGYLSYLAIIPALMSIPVDQCDRCRVVPFTSKSDGRMYLYLDLHRARMDGIITAEEWKKARDNLWKKHKRSQEWLQKYKREEIEKRLQEALK